MIKTTVFGLFTWEPTTFNKEWCLVCTKSRTHERMGTITCCVSCGYINDVPVDSAVKEDEPQPPFQISKYLQG